MEIVIDSSVLVGLLAPNDLWHTQATELFQTIKTDGHTGVYFDCVITESVSVAVRRLHEKGYPSSDIDALFKQLKIYVPDDTLTWILPDVPHLYQQALDLIRSSSGALNFNDALIALACRERHIPAIATFDADFDQVRWLHRLARPEDVRSN